MFKNKQ